MKFPFVSWRKPPTARYQKPPTKTSTRQGYDAAGYYVDKLLTRDGVNTIGVHFPTDRRRDYDRVKLVEFSRQFYAENAIYAGMISRASGYIVGNGFELQARTEDDDWNKSAESLWREFWRAPEIKNVNSGRQIERIICQELLITGESFVLLLDKGQIQVIESEQISRTYQDDGIDVDAYGRPVRFYVAPYSGGRVDTARAKATPSEFVIYATKTDRPAVLRAKPPCQSAFSMLHRINDVINSEAAAWQLLSRFAMAVLRSGGAELAFNESIADDSKASGNGDMANRIHETDYALIYHGEPGEDVKGIDRNIPGQNFSESVVMFMRLLGLPLGLPLEIILLDWTKSNYSQSRAVLEQAYQTFLGWQYLLEDRFYKKLYQWKLNEWVANGELKPRADQNAHEWIKPTFPWIDQYKEAQAYALRLDRSLVTHSMACKSIGMERKDVVDIRQSEIEDAITRAADIKARTGQDVPWQIFAGLEHDANAGEKTNDQSDADA